MIVQIFFRATVQLMRSTRVPEDLTLLLRDLSPSTRALALTVRDVIIASLPEVTEVVDAKARVVGYGYGRGYKDMVATIILSKSGVKIGLVHGASLDDPDYLLEGKGKVHRHIPFPGSTDAKSPAVASLLKASLDSWRTRSMARSNR